MTDYSSSHPHSGTVSVFYYHSVLDGKDPERENQRRTRKRMAMGLLVKERPLKEKKDFSTESDCKN